MEKFRHTLQTLFLICVGVGFVFTVYLLMGGGLPIDLNSAEVTIPFDSMILVWKPIDPSLGTPKVTHKSGNFKEGFGGLEYAYTTKTKSRPGFYSTAYLVEGFNTMTFWVKAKRPTTWQLQVKRKSDSKVYHRTFPVGTNWQKITITRYNLRDETTPGTHFKEQDLQQWMQFVDMSGTKHKDNILWLDHIHFVR